MTNKMENKNNETIERNYVVYKHTSPSGKVYIGITRQYPYEKRWQNGNGYKCNEHFWRAIQKYEWNNFEHDIIENNLTKEQAENMEIELIAKFKSNNREYGYNIENGGNAIGKTSEETRKKMSDNNKGGNNPQAKKVYCDGMIFGCVTDCANYYGINSKSVMINYLTGKVKMNKDFQKLNLHYATEKDLNECEKYDASKHGDKASIDITIREHSKTVHCDGIIFNTIIECANYYGVNKVTMKAWLLGNNPMNKDFQKLNLRYANENDLNECEKYDIKKHGNKASIDITIRECLKTVHCDGIIFNSIKECANYYGVNRINMINYLNGKVKMNKDFQKLNLRVANENDLNECEKYDIKKHGNKASIDITINKGSSKFIYCNGIIFNSMKECANYYNINRGTMKAWLTGKVKMNKDFQKLNLHYATEKDLNECEKYDASKHGDKASIDITINENKGKKKVIHCNGIIFNSIKECANYYNINVATMRNWLNGRCATPLNFQKLNLCVVTENDLNTYPRYTLANN